MALMADEEREDRWVKDEEAEHMNAFSAEVKQHSRWSAGQTALLTHPCKTLHSSLFNYANAHIYK